MENNNNINVENDKITEKDTVVAVVSTVTALSSNIVVPKNTDNSVFNIILSAFEFS